MALGITQGYFYRRRLVGLIKKKEVVDVRIFINNHTPLFSPGCKMSDGDIWSVSSKKEHELAIVDVTKMHIIYELCSLALDC